MTPSFRARVFDPERQRLGLNPDTAQLQSADLASAEVWLVNFPPDLDDQSPAPLGLADLKISPLTADAKAKLKQDLKASITDSKVLSLVISRLDRIAETPWEDGAGRNVSKAKETHPPTSSLSPMLFWRVPIPRAISRIAWPDELKSLKLKILETAMPRLSHARFSTRIVRAGRYSPTRRGRRSKI